MKNKVGIFILAGMFFAGGCATYESKPVPIRPASSYALQARPQYSAVPAQPQYTAAPAQPQGTTGVPAEQPSTATTQGTGQAPTPPPPAQGYSTAIVVQCPYCNATNTVPSVGKYSCSNCKRYFEVVSTAVSVPPPVVVTPPPVYYYPPYPYYPWYGLGLNFAFRFRQECRREFRRGFTRGFERGCGHGHGHGHGHR